MPCRCKCLTGYRKLSHEGVVVTVRFTNPYGMSRVEYWRPIITLKLIAVIEILVLRSILVATQHANVR